MPDLKVDIMCTLDDIPHTIPEDDVLVNNISKLVISRKQVEDENKSEGGIGKLYIIGKTLGQ